MEFGVLPILLSGKESMVEPVNQLELPHTIDTIGGYLETSLSSTRFEQATGDMGSP
jgi:hypothetical protein